MRWLNDFRKLKNEANRSKYLFPIALLVSQLFLALVHMPTAFAAPTFSDYPITSTYKKPGAMTVAGGDVWYLESTIANGPIDAIGRMTTSGVTTDYSIGSPSMTVRAQLITGPDGNVWFTGSNASGVSLGKLDISTGTITFYGSSVSSYSAGSIGTGPDGKIYYSAKYAGSPANSYLLALDPTTGTSTTVQTYDTYTNIGSITSGPDGRVYVTDGYYNRIYAVSVSGGSSDIFYLPVTPANITTGPDGNLWFITSGKIVKITTTGLRTEYTLPTGVSARKLVAGPDGALWFTDGKYHAQKIGRITITGVITMYTIPVANIYDIDGPVLGPDGAIWFDYYIPNGVQKVGRITTAPTFDTYAITPTYKKPGATTMAGGALWYLESTNASGPIDSIGRMTTSGATTDYSIGYPSGVTAITVRPQLITGPDGNVWFIGSTASGVYLGKLDISTGVVTFYGSSVSSYLAGSIGTGSDGKIYYSAKYAGSPANSYLLALDPTTGTSTTVRTYDTYTNISGIVTGSDGRVYVTDGYYDRIYAVAIISGTDEIFYLPDVAGGVTSGPDSNLWFTMSGKIVKMTTAGLRTEYTLPVAMQVRQLAAGSDGAVWFLDGTYHAQKIGRITTTGVVTTYTIPDANVYDSAGPVLGPDGAIWFDYYIPNSVQKVGRIGY